MGEISNKQCSHLVPYDCWGHTYPCQKKATTERDGKSYCKIHDPKYIAEKNAERTAKYEAEMAEARTRRELEHAAVRACKEINPDNPLAVARSIKDLYEACKSIYEDYGFAFLKDILAKAEGKWNAG